MPDFCSVNSVRRTIWPDKRLEDAARRIDWRFDRVDERFDEIDRRFDHIDGRLDRIDDSVRHLTTTVMWVGGGTFATLVGAISAVAING